MLEPSVLSNIYTLLSYLSIQEEQVEILEEEGIIKINLNIPEENAGIFIGRYAETLDGVQRVISAFINNGNEVHQSVIVDVAGYRDRRYSKLEEISARLSEEVKQYGLPLAFPMGLSATERRQIHLLFSEDAELTTYSEGEGSSRRLYLALKA